MTCGQRSAMRELTVVGFRRVSKSGTWITFSRTGLEDHCDSSVSGGYFATGTHRRRALSLTMAAAWPVIRGLMGLAWVMTMTTERASLRATRSSERAVVRATEVSALPPGQARRGICSATEATSAVRWLTQRTPHSNSSSGGGSPSCGPLVQRKRALKLLGPEKTRRPSRVPVSPAKAPASAPAAANMALHPASWTLALPSSNSTTSSLEAHWRVGRPGASAQACALHGLYSRRAGASASGQSPLPTADTSTIRWRCCRPSLHILEHALQSPQSASLQSLSHA
mmetsp:Transcript_85398/g.276508  ORF Transcript_85398/g.276508 Transcript_85398/m.276508 type:complete len:283 (+) Transcript_85398:278-1126(+)